MILYPEETSWNTLRFDKRNYTIQKAKEQQKEIIKKLSVWTVSCESYPHTD